MAARLTGPAASPGPSASSRPVAVVTGLLLLAATLVTIHRLAVDAEGRTLAYALAIGLALGITLQRTRFCFFCHLRDLIVGRDARGALAILLALAVGTVGMHLLFMAWLPVPTAGRLPPDAHIGPVSWALVLAAAAFGLGMVVSGSCIGAHWYRLGEGAPIAPFALIGSAAGFLIGFNTWDALFRQTIATAPVIWLPSRLGYGGSLALQLAGLGLLAWLAWRRQLRGLVGRSVDGRAVAGRTDAPGPSHSISDLWARLFGPRRWPYWVGGLLVGWIAMLDLLRLRPLGVTAALGSGARSLGERLGIVPASLPGLDALGGCATVLAGSWWQAPNTLLILGLVAGAFAMALVAGQFQPRRPRASEIARGLAGGLLLGWGAMTALGCTVGTLLSGTMAGALSGWVFGAVMLLVVWGGVKLGWAPPLPMASASS